jgi:hypothetical protein
VSAMKKRPDPTPEIGPFGSTLNPYEGREVNVLHLGHQKFVPLWLMV